MPNEPLISVIIPVYKVEMYLGKCMEPVLSQTYRNLEIILVDDGSPDSSGRMCDEYARKDRRVRVIHKENGGLSDARNAGLDISSGEYIAFIDSDDYVSRYYIENLYKALKKWDTEIAVSCFESVFEDNPPKSRASLAKDPDMRLYSVTECLRNICYQNSGIEISAWGKLYHRRLFSEIRYPKGALYEDIPVTPRLLGMCSGVAAVSCIDYYYRQRKGSIRSHSFNMKKMDAINYTRELMEHISASYPELKPAAECRYFSTVCHMLFHIDRREYPEVCRELWSDIVRYRGDILKDPHGRKKAKIGAMISYFGYHVMKASFGIMTSKKEIKS